MSGDVQPIPEGYHSITPYLVVQDARAAIEFYKQAFGAEELLRLDAPGGKIGHAEMRIGDSRIMLADEHPEHDALSPKTLGGSPINLVLYVEDVDARFDQAVAAGAAVKRPLVDQFYGDRSGLVTDPFGHTWTICTHIEDVSQEEVTRRFEEMCSGSQEG